MKMLECTDERLGLLIADYEQGWLAEEPELKQQFQEHMKACEYCRVSLECLAPMWEVLRKNPELVDEAIRIIDRENRRRIMGAVAAMVLLVVSGFWSYSYYTDQKTKTKLAAEAQFKLTPEEFEMIRAGGATGPADEGIEALRRGDYTEAITNLQIAVKERADNPLYHYYLGLAYGMIGNYKASIPELEASLVRSKGALQMDARWYMANAYLKLKRVDDSRHIFQMLAASANPRQTEARAMLTRIAALEGNKESKNR